MFQDAVVSIPPATFYWSNFVADIEWKKVWTLPQKFLLTNKIKEISFKLIHKFYPARHYLSKFKSNINVNCSFCQGQPETFTHLFWSCEFTYKFWRDFQKFIADFVFSDFCPYFKNVIFGFHHFNHKDGNAFYFINLFLFLAKFHIHKSKFTNSKPEFFLLKKELEQYMMTISLSKNTKALRTIDICKSLKLFT